MGFAVGITSCEKGALPRRALELLLEKRQSLVEPNLISYRACINASEKGGRWADALRILDQMRESELKPDEYCVSAVISAVEKGVDGGVGTAHGNEALSGRTKCSKLQCWDQCL